MCHWVSSPGTYVAWQPGSLVAFSGQVSAHDHGWAGQQVPGPLLFRLISALTDLHRSRSIARPPVDVVANFSRMASATLDDPVGAGCRSLLESVERVYLHSHQRLFRPPPSSRRHSMCGGGAHSLDRVTELSTSVALCHMARALTGLSRQVYHLLLRTQPAIL